MRGRGFLFLFFFFYSGIVVGELCFEVIDANFVAEKKLYVTEGDLSAERPS